MVRDPKGISYDDDDITEVVPNNQKKKTFNQESTQNNESKTCEKCGLIKKKKRYFYCDNC